MTDPLTPAELNAIEARANAATPGPWNWYPHVGRRESSRYEMENLCGAPGHGEVLGINSETFSELETEEWIDGYPRDFDFISASRTDVPRLVDEVRRLTAELSDIHETHRRIISEQCPIDERHCTCVPALRSELEKVTAERDELKRKLDSITTSHRGK